MSQETIKRIDRGIKMNKVRITYYGKNGTMFSYLEEYEDEYTIESGAWEAPFEDTPAIGAWESLIQSDRCPLDFHSEPIIMIRVSRIDYED